MGRFIGVPQILGLAFRAPLDSVKPPPWKCRKYLLQLRLAYIEVVECDLDDLVGGGDEGVEQAVDIWRVSLGEVGRRENPAILSERARVHQTLATCKTAKHTSLHYVLYPSNSGAFATTNTWTYSQRYVISRVVQSV